jgi:hypothetical protein
MARIAAVDPQRRGAEHLAAARAARVVAQHRQGGPGQQRADRRQVDPVQPEVARRRRLGLDPAVGRQQIELDQISRPSTPGSIRSSTSASQLPRSSSRRPAWPSAACVTA